MDYTIEYAVNCDKGKIRAKNQDNFWCMGKFLGSANDGLHKSITNTVEAGNNPAFAVFDGMGGEQQGEVAAYIAACGFDTAYKENSKNDPKAFLLNACFSMNEKICEHADKNHINSTGTTAAILLFGKKDIYICNIGDSRIYQYSDKTLTQISLDHIGTSMSNRKPPLTQNLGIPETELMIDPYVAKGIYDDGDKYLICSDGLTDMVSEEEIAEILEKNSPIDKCAEALLGKALESGGKDNVTLILCRVHRKRRIINLIDTMKNRARLS